MHIPLGPDGGVGHVAPARGEKVLCPRTGERSGPPPALLFLFLLQVGAAISMTYITSKPIVFVGTGQTYCDLRSLNAKAVVAALMKA